jgi:hypothetical protein
VIFDAVAIFLALRAAFRVCLGSSVPPNRFTHERSISGTHARLQDRLQCSETCPSEATTHCTEAGGRYAETIHLRLLLYCAEICRTAADFLLTKLAAAHSSLRADVCDACTRNCEQVGREDLCVRRPAAVPQVVAEWKQVVV